MIYRKCLSFVISEEDANVVVTEYLRYAGIISVSGMGHTGYIPTDVKRRLEPGIIITIECPKDVNYEVWVNQNIGRLRSFGVQALAWKERK